MRRATASGLARLVGSFLLAALVLPLALDTPRFAAEAVGGHVGEIVVEPASVFSSAELVELMPCVRSRSFADQDTPDSWSVIDQTP